MSDRKAPARAFAEYVAELLTEFHPIELKHFFSGFSLNVDDGLQLGWVSGDGTFYLRILAEDRAEIVSLGGAPFTYGSDEQARVLHAYYSVPAGLMEEPEQLNRWAARAHEAALISQAKKRKPAGRKAAS